MVRLGTLSLSCAAAFALAACQVPQSALHATNRTAAVAPAPSNPPPAPQDAEAGAPAGAPTGAPAAKPSLLAATPAVAHGVEGAATTIAPAAHLTGDPKELVGLDHTVVRRALGDPQHIRNEMPAQVWQYATGDCIVDLYLYDQDGAWTVTYVEARSHTAEQEPTARCLKSLLERPTASAG
jgi:hypothetical protein